MGKTTSSVKEFATIAFILLGVLFGMLIMTFIFAQMGSNTNSIDDVTSTITNKPGAYINGTGYTISQVSNSNFTGGFTVTTILNATDGVTITSGNYTVDSDAGTIFNTTATNWVDVNVTYTIIEKTGVKEAAEETQNNSLQGIVSYTAQSNTQMITVAIAITLIILVAVFLFFWKAFVSNKKESQMSGGNFS